MKQLINKSIWVATVLGGLALLAAPVIAEDAVCARVKIEIKQELTLERQGFDAEMAIHNTLEGVNLTDVAVTVKFMDENGLAVIASSDPNSTDARFFIRIASQENIDNVSGTGVVVGGTTATINWLIIPAPGAAGTTPFGKKYLVGATLSYKMGAEAQTVDVTPDVITVKPMPLLSLDYFLTRDVEADDPLTAPIEPIVPFTLGVRVKNDGLAAAKSLKIDSAQPKIIENEQGLLINFQLTGSSLNDMPAENTLLLNFGDINAGTAKMGRWIMESTLAGKFTEFTARFSHADELGGTLTSLIQGVNTHLLLRDVRVDQAGRDVLRDFLAAETDGTLKVYESDSADSPVQNISSQASLSANGTSNGVALYQLNAPATAGFFYIKKPDPFNGSKALGNMSRADNKVMAPENVWLSRTRHPDTKAWEYWVNIFDFNSPGSYRTEFVELPPSATAPQIGFIADRTLKEGERVTFVVDASTPSAAPALTANPLPAGAAFAVESQQGGLTTAIFDWSPAVGQAGSYLIVYTATEGGRSSSRSAIITVETQEPPPGPGTPQIETPVTGQAVTALRPALIVRTGTHPQDPTTQVVFQLFADAALTQQIATATIAKGQTTGAEGTTSWTVPQDLTDNTNYWWRARAYDGSATYSAWENGSFFVNQFNEAPSSVVLLTPLHNADVAEAMPVLTLQNSHDVDGDAITYGFDVYADEALAQRLTGVTGLAPGVDGSTSWTVDVPLQNHVRYYWQAEAKDASGTATRSTAQGFEVNTQNTAPTVPVRIAPAANATLTTTAATLTAQASTDAENDAVTYVIELDAVSTFDSAAYRASPTLTGSGGQISWSTTALTDNTHYYWRVTASDGRTSSISEVGQFFVNQANDAPPVPVTGNPGNESWVSTSTPQLSTYAVTDVDGDAVQYRYAVYSNEAMTTQVFTTVSSDIQMNVTTALADHKAYYWRVRAEDGLGGVSAWSAASKFYVSTTAYVAPTITLTKPYNPYGPTEPSLTQGNKTIYIFWSGTAPNVSANVSLYYDTTGSGFAGTPIVEGLSQSYGTSNNFYNWNVNDLAPGKYYIYGVIYDPQGISRKYANGIVVIAKPDPAGQVIVSPVNNMIPEAGFTKLNVSLSQQPTDTVIVSYTTSNAEEITTTWDATFTTTNWSSPKEIAVSGVQDCAIDGEHVVALNGVRIVSADIEYTGVIPPSTTVTHGDNDVGAYQYSDNPNIGMCAPFKMSTTNPSPGVYQHTIGVDFTNIGPNVTGLTAVPVVTPEGWTIVAPLKLGLFPTATTRRAKHGNIMVVQTNSPNFTIPVMQWHVETQ